MSHPAPLPLHPRLRALNAQIDEAPGPVTLAGLAGAAPALVLAARRRASGGPTLVVVGSQADAERLAEELSLLSGAPAGEVLLYPAWDVHPYDGLSPHIDLHFQRLSALRALAGGQRSLVIAPAEALLKRVVSPAYLASRVRRLSAGGRVDPTALADHLSRVGYLATDRVVEAASFSVRGGIIDLFPPGHAWPVRVELWGDTIEGLREFHPDSQRSIRALTAVDLWPTREELLLPEDVEAATRGLRQIEGDRGLPPKHRRRLAEDLTEGLYFPNVEYFLPALSPTLGTVLDHQGDRGRLVLLEPARVREALLGAWDRTIHRFAELRASEPLLPEPEHLFLHEDLLWESLTARVSLSLGMAPPALAAGQRITLATEPTAGLRQSLLTHRDEGMLTPLVERVRSWARAGARTYVACHSRVQAERLADLLEPYGVRVPRPVDPSPALFLAAPAPNAAHPAPIPVVGSLSAGFAFPDVGVVVVSEEEIFGPRVKPQATPHAFLKNAIDSFSQLKVGDFVVHALHGIGIFRGVSRMGVGEGVADFVSLEYAGGDKLYLPVHRLHTLQRYVGHKGSEPALDKMGGQSWKKTTRKVKESVLKIARHLLELYAARTLARGNAFQEDRLALEAFESAFPYDETPDQMEAIHAVLKDMQSPRPMDRLVVGDVGYGKTEVALRAAFVAVENGYQVGVLVPTTVLAFQHARTFAQRFEGHPVNIAQLSRFVSASEQDRICADLARGAVDIVIGTHRILSHDVRFKRLGLLIVDEEHRFGVKHKEAIKKLRKDVDVLTMTATPIPRTLHMATAGLRDLSVIATPPRDRTAIRTFVTPWSARKIQAAIEEEKARGGQVYFVHNRVQSIDAMARYLATLVPAARFDVVHGQMGEERIEGAMKRFIDGETDVLVTTAIVESGLDVPRANTIIINRADRLGLAQLYQLRGRVGRADKRAFAYLLTPAGGPPTDRSSRRLLALEAHSELGAGFKIASEDLEMRGAGDLLGKNQSGSIAAVGFETYVELLHKAVLELSGQADDEDFDPDVDVRVPSFIPEDYIPDFQQRLQLYRELATAGSELELRQRAEELADVHGHPPEPVRELLKVMQVRVEAKRLRIAQLTATAGRLTLRFDDSTPVDRVRLARTAVAQPDRYRLTPDGRLTVKLRDEEGEDLAATATNLLRRLG